MSKDIAKKKETDISTNVVSFEQDGDQGFEEADSDSYSIPFVRILQSGSPQCKKSDGAHIEGAEEGTIINTATNELFESLRVIPCHFRRVFVEWKPIDEGGGFVAEYNAEEGKTLALTLDDAYKLPNGNELADTRMHYCIDATTGDAMVLCMGSTQIKKSKNWMNVMRSTKAEREDGTRFKAPMFSSIFSLNTVPESNDKGSWFGWKIEREGFVEDTDLYAAAKVFRGMIVDGKTEVKHEKDGASSDDAEGTTEEF